MNNDENLVESTDSGKGEVSRRYPRRHLASCRYSVTQLIRERQREEARNGMRLSGSTKRDRAQMLLRSVTQLYQLGYHVRKIRNLDTRHVMALVQHWERNGMSASALQKNLSYLRTLARWINKQGMIGGLSQYLIEPTRGLRRRHAVEDKSWSAKATDYWAKIREVTFDDPRVGLILLLMAAFMLRMREASLLEPTVAEDPAAPGWLHLTRGTKNGRERHVPIVTLWQRGILERAKGCVTSREGTLVPAEKSFAAWRTHFYRVCARHGISRKDGLLPHGLRHQGANDLYQELTGLKSPVRGGEVPQTKEEKAKDRLARMRVARILGHGRVQVTAAYYGTHRPTNTDSTDTALANGAGR